MKLKIALGAVVILGGLYAAHHYLNEKPQYHATAPSSDTPAGGVVRQSFTVGFLPVTCHLTCPVTSWVTRHSAKGTQFQAQKFTDFPSMKEALIARKIDATFMIAPLAMKLAADGVPVKIVYLGHRDGSALVVAKDSDIHTFTDLRGKTVAIPSRFSNQNLLMHRMMKQYGMKDGDILLKEVPPPEHPAALGAKAVDGFIVGEPHCSKAELEGYGRILYEMSELWPDFISCVLVVRQEVINDQRELVDELVRGIAASGEWLDADRATGAQHRKDAALVVGTQFYNQDPKLLEYVLMKPDRVSYSDLKPPKATFEEIMDLAVSTNIIPKRMKFEEYCDTSFAPDLETVSLPFDRMPGLDQISQQKK
ncbi:MAG: ABC transporter substrate-binding protein [Planctomycetota bacterium]|nr:ABC transporter substrate-binding protein [Planctomycetota bacterium]